MHLISVQRLREVRQLRLPPHLRVVVRPLAGQVERPDAGENVGGVLRPFVGILAQTIEYELVNTMRQRLAQEGRVMADAGCAGPTLDPDDLDYTRAVLDPLLDETDERVSMECLFGDVPCRPLGFTPRGLSPWAGLALALHDARAVAAGQA